MKFVRKLVMIFVYLFLYAPLFVMIFFSFNEGKSTSFFSGFSFKWYIELFTNDRYLISCLLNSLMLAVISALTATVLGTVAALGIYKMKNKHLAGTYMTVNNIPMMNPDIVTGVSLMLLFVFVSGILSSGRDSVNFWTLLISHITFNLPYVVLNVLPRLRLTDVSLSEAAQDLGCSPSQAFFKVVLPEVTPGILSGLLMAFTLSFDDFVISYYTSGTDFVTLPVYIYSLVKKTVKPDIYALYSIILVLILALLIGYNFLQGKSLTKKGQKSNEKNHFNLLAGAVILLSVFSLTGCGTNNTVKSLVCEYSREYAGTTLNVYNWGEYISDGSEGSLDTVAAFEKVTGINVNYITYESNEVMYSKLKSGSVSYDVIIPSDYMIARLMSEDMLMKIDYSKIANYSLIDAKYKDLYFDPTNEYSVPYSVGLFGLIYNTKYVEREKLGCNVGRAI